jgi:hypothetical protein
MRYSYLAASRVATAPSTAPARAPPTPDQIASRTAARSRRTSSSMRKSMSRPIRRCAPRATSYRIPAAPPTQARQVTTSTKGTTAKVSAPLTHSSIRGSSIATSSRTSSTGYSDVHR